MGVLSITPRSVRLQNLGDVQRVNTNNGATEAWGSSARLGNAVAGLGQTVGNIAVDLHQFEQKTRFNEFIQELQTNTNTLMNGDGKDNKGLIHEDFKDSNEWAERVKKERNKILEAAKKNHKITDHEWNTQVKQMTFGFQEQWDGRCANHAWTVVDKNAQQAAKARLKTCEETLAMGDGTPEMYADWMRSLNEDIEKSHVTDETVAARMRRDAGLRLMNTQYANKLKIASAVTENLEDVQEVRKAFDAQFAGVVKPDGTYDYSSIIKNELVAQALGKEGLAGFEKAFEADFKKARRAAEQAAQARRRYKQIDTINESTNAQTAMVLGEGDFGKDWDNLSPADKASRYEDWLKSPSGIVDGDGKPLIWIDALKKYAPDRAARVASTINTYKKQQSTLDAKDAKVGAKTEAKATAEDYKYLLRQPVAYVTDEKGEVMYDAKGQPIVTDFTPQMRIDTAENLWRAGVITETDMRGIVRSNRTEFTDDMKRLATETLTELGVSCPKAVAYHAKEADGSGSFVFNPQTKVKTDDVGTSIKHGEDSWWFDFTKPVDIWEQVKYGDTIEALNLTQDWMMAHPEKTVEDGKKYLKGLLEGKDTEGKYLRLKMQEHFNRERAQINQLQNNFSRGGRAMSLGISPSGNVMQIPSKK